MIPVEHELQQEADLVLLSRLSSARANGDPDKYLACITVAEAHAAATLIRRLSAVPSAVRDRLYFPIIMPLDKRGMGPASESKGQIRKITWEVWDQFCETFGSFDCLPDAIQEAERLNREYYVRQVAP
jgi:hypothetical protein